ncbi:hypothetical protein [Actinophytocola glycyrrhizae]|uniref:Uncharacterized protein n=1 Tax=Actinophytocola glycyrrhizae TaxID=2044873 RepID=A0ABV9RW27_9PSEU
MSEQSVMTTPIFDELVNELGSRPEGETTANQQEQDEDRPRDDR